MQLQKILPLPKGYKALLGALALLLLLAMYLFQRFNFLGFLLSIFEQSPQHIHPYYFFVFNKAVRLVVNDLCCFILIFVLFRERKYLNVAFWVFLFELVIVLPLYFTLKLTIEGDSEISSPLLSQLHRLIINPTLMLLLMIAFVYQRFKQHKPER